MTGIRCLQVDAFTDRPFSGNPAAVCLLDRPLEESVMQSIAAEMNLSETAFIEPAESGFHLRWFTPVVEVALCGHATLASAHALWSTGVVDRGKQIRFHTQSGVLTAKSEGDLIWLDFPSLQVEPATASPALMEVLGATEIFYGKSHEDVFVVVDSEAALRELNPDFRRLADFDVRGVIATSQSTDPRYDFASRFFAPSCGIDEDPVTGSAHCRLAPYWAAVHGKHDLIGHQVSRRGGVVQVRVRGDRVLLGGQAVTILNGQLNVPPGGNCG